jgi:hypothetical protein
MSGDWIRKDSLMIGFFIIILLIYQWQKIPLILKIFLINLMAILIILTHEVFAFFSLPILFLLPHKKQTAYLFSTLSWFQEHLQQQVCPFVWQLPSVH